MTPASLDMLDRKILNALQDDFPISSRPYAEAAGQLGLDEEQLIRRLKAMLESGVLSRFGPLFDAERLGGLVTLAAVSVPPEIFEDVADFINGYPEVAHNYERDHHFNMWFVLASDRPERLGEVLSEIEAETGLRVLNLPKEEEYFLELKLKL